MICVSQFVSTWQYGMFAGTIATGDTRESRTPSGTSSRMSQLSVDVRPVLVPPCTKTPLASRALTPTVHAVPVLDLLRRSCRRAS